MLCSISLCPQLPIWVQHSHHHLPNHVAFEFFSSLLLFTSFHSAFNYFVQKTTLFQNMPNSWMFPLPNRILYLPVFVYSPENCLIINFMKPALIFSIFLHIHISKASNILLLMCIYIQISAAYSATLQTKHFVILFFCSTLLVNNFFFSINPFSPSQFCSNSFSCNIHPLMSSYLNTWIHTELVHLFHLLSINIDFWFIVSLTAYVHHLCLLHVNLHTELSGDLIQVIH